MKDKKIEDFYQSFLTFTELLFHRFSSRNELDFQSIQNMIRMAYEFVLQDRNQIVYVMQTAEHYNNPHVAHAVRSCIVAIIIGAYLKMPRHHMIELGIAGLLCNISIIGMSSDRAYTISEGSTDLLATGTDDEKKLMYVHPIQASQILKDFNYPMSVCEAVLQHHEMEDGSGFPRQIKGTRICFYGKILVVAGFFEAFSMQRIDGIKSSHNAMMQILKNAEAFDTSVVQALVNSISIYPAGTYVLLSNGDRGQVLGVDQDNPRFPIVELYEKKPRKETLRTTDEVSITRQLTSEEIESSVEKPAEEK